MSAPLEAVPLTALEPDQPPAAVQAVALAEDQVKLEAAPLCTVVGLAARLTVGAAALTETVVDCVALPPAPVQVRV